MTKISLFVFGLLALCCQAMAAPVSCYMKELQTYRPAAPANLIVLVDTSTARDGAVEKDFLASVETAANRPGNIVLMSYAGHAPGQALRLIDRWSIEAPMTREDILQDVVISTVKEHKRCIDLQKKQARAGLTAALETVLATMPIATERSEIASSLSTALQEFASPDRPTLVVHLSDGLQHAKGGRSFYLNRQARLIDPAKELAYFAKDPSTAPRAKTGFVSVVWYGMLAMPASVQGSKPDYLDGKTIASFRSFWTKFLATQGVEKVQVGTPTVLNPDLSVPVLGPQ